LGADYGLKLPTTLALATKKDDLTVRDTGRFSGGRKPVQQSKSHLDKKYLRKKEGGRGPEAKGEGKRKHIRIYSMKTKKKKYLAAWSIKPSKKNTGMKTPKGTTKPTV